MRRFNIIIIWLLGFVLHANAFNAIESYQNQLQGRIKKGDTLIVKDEKFLNNAFDWTKIHNQTVNNIVTFGLFRDSGYVFTKSFKCQVELKIEYWSQPDQADPVIVDHVKLDIGYDSIAGKAYQASANYRFMNGYRVKITVNDITSAELGSTLPAAFSLTGQVVIERSYDIAANNTIVPQVTIVGAANASARTSSTVTGNNVSLIWTKILGAEEYDLEWTFIDEESANGGVLTQAGTGVTTTTLERMFRNNATRVTIPHEYYDISLVNFSKYLLIRIRTVQYLADGFRQTGAWNYDLDQGGTTGPGVITLDETAAWHLPALNWQYSAVYAEEGKKKEIVSYFDGTLRSRQTVTVNNSDNKAIVQESLYDEFGRPLASILPAPLTDNKLTYYPGLHLTSTGSTYNFSNVYGAGTNCINTPQPLGTSSGAGKYYSPNNDFLADEQNKYIPDAGGYPFAVTVYTADNTNRPKVQGGVGALFQPGPDLATSKATRYYYDKPQQWELDRMFGNDAGYASHYLKNMVIDGNGQISVSYQNASGKTVATALVGETPANTDALASKPAATTETFLVLQPDDFTFDNAKLKLSATTTYTSAVPGPVSLVYTADKLIKTYANNGVTICSNCYYELKIRVTDDCNRVIYNTASALPVGSLTSDCNNTTPATGTINVNFDKIGEYYIAFELGLTEDAIRNYTDDFVKRNTNLNTQWQFIQNALWGSDFSSCFSECSTCKASLGEKVDFIARVKARLADQNVDIVANATAINSWADSLYNNLSAQCLALRASCAPSPCADLENQMKLDVSPGGQYALFDTAYAPLEQGINVLFLHWRDSFPIKPSTDADYIKEQFEDEDGVLRSPYDEDFALEDLVKYWKSEWASKFVPFHPEYCALLFCNANSSYLQWDDNLVNLAATVSDIPALASGVTYSNSNPVWLVAGDPFFTSTAGAGYKNAFIAALNNYSGSVLNITQVGTKNLSAYIDYSLYCSDKTGSANSSTNSDNWTNCTPVGSCRIADLEWRMYRDKYMELKQQYYDQLRNSAYCGSLCPVGSKLSVSTGDCPPTASFILQETDSTCTGGRKVKILYIGTAALQKAVTVNIYYPAEYNSISKTTSVPFAIGQTESTICVADTISVEAMHISGLSCNTTSGSGGSGTSASYSCSDYDVPSSYSMSVSASPGTSTFTLTYNGTKAIPAGVTVAYNAGFYVVANGSNPLNLYGTFNFTSGTSTVSVTVTNSQGYTVDRYGYISITCSGSPVVTPTCDPAYQNKVSRIVNLSYSTSAVSNDTTVLKAYANAQIAAQIAANCEAQADTWLQQLDDCLQSNLDYLAKKDQLRAKLIEICKLGGDMNHPNGSITTPSGSATTEGYTSFKDAIKGVLDITTFSMICNPWLIDAPYPYDVKEQSASHTIDKTSADVCAKLTTITQEYTSSGSTLSLYQYLTTKYGTAMNLSSAEFSALQNGCTNCRYLLAQPIQLPVFLDGTAKGCVTATEFQAGLTAMGQESWMDITKPEYEGIYSTYLNQRWGFTLSYSDYKAYVDLLVTTPTAVLCNHPVYSTVTQDPYECMMRVMDNAVAKGIFLYKEYITEIRRQFRKDYIAYCAVVKPKLQMTASQQYYHFTLYYYDQAGNLVRTVPPEGVHLLNGSLQEQIKIARANQEVTCDYNDAVVNKDKPTALQQLTTLLDAGGNSAMEMWLYNSSMGSNQVLFTTGGNKYLVNTCIDGTYLHLDTYMLVPSADGKTVDATLSTHTAANLQGITMTQWTHVVLQGVGLNTNNLSVYVNGKACPLAPNAPNGSCGWEINATATAITYPESITTLKHIRLYNRLLTAAEIAANAGVPCLSLSPTYATALNTNLQYWGRFNVPTAGSVTTIGGTSTTETQYSAVYPAHTIPTSYAYHSLNGVENSFAPDNTGNSRFWYDRLGRVVFSHNWEQFAPANGGVVNRYSYTAYDAQGRITEVGEKSGTMTLVATPFLTDAQVNTMLTTGTNIQVTKTTYDEPYAAAGLTQTNLRKRVSAVTYQDVASGTPQQATYYSYDQLGNVKTLWQQIQDLGTKRIDYQYDLVSGKVNKVLYQRDATDKFYYDYQYDAENRLTTARTGINSVSADGWEIENPKTDAAYRYYLHGPLARMELGNTSLVQGVDYAYTLQGWIKGVNGNYLNVANDMGKDGVVGGDRAVVGRDAYAYTLDYYNGDYQSIGTQTALNLSWSAQSGDIMGRNLYNGNISRSTVALSKINTGSPVGYSYRYDQLNRLVGMRQHGLTPGATTWNALSAGTAFSEEMKYDGNGNILNYVRNGSTANGKQAAMDNLSYTYTRDGNGYLVRNRLSQVKDAVTGDPYTEDISNQAANNYLYDNIGNLMKDVQGGVSNIQWTVYGKIKSITKTDGSSLEYRYDATGNRVYKAYTHSGVTDKTWYVRDAQGNTLAVYGNKDGGSDLYWKEQQLYGSSRLGIWEPNTLVSSDVSTTWNTLGLKRYELGNHLGNVLATISDKAVQEGDHYISEVLSAQDYYPFGMLQPDRRYSLGAYRYGFNGKENDNEVKGEGNQQDYGMRVYDPRIGKFLSVDPLTKSYPQLTPYQFSGNTPIQATDLDGAETFIEREGNARRRYAEMKVAQADQIRIQTEMRKYREPHILLSDIFGNGHMGPESIVIRNVAKIKNDYDDALGATIASGPFASAGYLIGGDRSAFKWSVADGVMTSFGGIPANGSSVFPQVVRGQSSTNIAYTETGASAGKQMNAYQIGSYNQNKQAQGPRLNYQIEGNMIGGEIVYPDGKVNEFLAYRNVTSNGKTLELTTFILYPKGAMGNELKNEFGRSAMLETFELFVQDAKEHGFDNLRLQFERAPNSSSAKPGKAVDVTIDVNKKKK